MSQLAFDWNCMHFSPLMPNWRCAPTHQVHIPCWLFANHYINAVQLRVHITITIVFYRHRESQCIGFNWATIIEYLLDENRIEKWNRIDWFDYADGTSVPRIASNCKFCGQNPSEILIHRYVCPSFAARMLLSIRSFNVLCERWINQKLMGWMLESIGFDCGEWSAPTDERKRMPLMWKNGESSLRE